MPEVTESEVVEARCTAWGASVFGVRGDLKLGEHQTDTPVEYVARAAEMVADVDNDDFVVLFPEFKVESAPRGEHEKPYPIRLQMIESATDYGQEVPLSELQELAELFD